MKAKELRIGNLLQSNIDPDKEIVQVEQIGRLKDDYCVSTQHFPPLLVSMCSPIPLTEEWHNKFNVYINGHLSYIYELPKNNNMFSAIVFSGDYVYIRQGRKPSEYDLVSIWNKDLTKRDMYIHEFQNLYLALTGEELTIKD